MKIDGPVNIARIENEKTKKVIYLFMDIHYDITNETKCGDPISNNIKNYLLNNFSSSTNTIDFFFEVKPEQLRNNSIDYSKKRYIEELLYLFRYEFNKNKDERIFSNIRYHVMDIRNYLRDGTNRNKENLEINIQKLWHNFNNYNVRMLNSIQYDINKIGNNIENIYIYLKNKVSTNKDSKKKKKKIKCIIEEYKKNKSDEKILGENIKKILDKIKNSVKNNNVSEYILDNYLFDIFIKALKTIKKLNEKIESIKKKLLNNNKSYIIKNGLIYNKGNNDKRNNITFIVNQTENLIEYLISIYNNLMDLYNIRRILDKERIKNIIMYTGLNHSINIIYYLCNYCGYRITNLSKKNENINIKNKMNRNDLIKLIYVEPLIQCSDVKDFPNNFN